MAVLYKQKNIPVNSYCYQYRSSTYYGDTGHYYGTLPWEKYKREYYLPPESRPFPADPFKSMTGRLEQSRTYGVGARTPWVVLEEGPEAIAGHTYRWWGREWWLAENPYTGSLRPVMTWPDWSLPLRLKIKDESINLGQTLAEYRQTASMFGDAAKGVVNAWRAFKKKKFLKNRSMCSVSAAHLIYDYGVAPLVSDMFDSYEALRHRLEKPVHKRYFIKQTCEKEVLELEDVYYGLGKSGPFTCEQTGDQYTTAYVELDLEKLSMFTPGNPLEIVWERVPYSFVVDWFIPIGDTLSALSALGGVKSVNVSVVRKRRQYEVRTPYITDVFGVKHPPERKGFTNFEAITRSVYNTIPLPAIPQFDFDATVSKLLNAVSLLVNARGCRGVMPRFSKKDFGM